MRYEDIIRKYEGKRRRQIALVIVIGIVILIAVIASDIFVQSLFKDTGKAADPHLIGNGLLIIICILVSAAISAAVGVLIWQMKKTRSRIKAIQEVTSLTDDEIFAEVINSSNTLPTLKNVYISDDYLINLDSFWGCRIDSITDVKKETSDYTVNDGSGYFMVAVYHDGRKSCVYATELTQNKVYKAIYEVWQQSAAAVKSN